MRNKHDDNSPRAAQAAQVAGPLKSVMVALHLHKAMASSHRGDTDSPLQAKDNMDSPLQAKDNMDSPLLAKDNTDSPLPAKDNTDSHKADMVAQASSSQVAMEDRHRTSALMVVNRVAMVLLPPHRDTKQRWKFHPREVEGL
jgi:hypothetical protein